MSKIFLFFCCVASGTFMVARNWAWADGAKTQTEASDQMSQFIAKLKKELPKDTLDNLKSLKQEDLISTHFGLALTIRNKYLRNEENKDILEYFKRRKVNHVDDMSSKIIESLWIDLQGKK